MGPTLLPTYLQYILVFREMPRPGSSSVTNSPTPRGPLGSIVCLDTEEILKAVNLNQPERTWKKYKEKWMGKISRERSNRKRQ